MDASLAPVTATADTDGMFIRTMHDDQGRTLLALDAAATYALSGLLDGIDYDDLLIAAPGNVGPDQGAVLVAIRSALARHLRTFHGA